MQQQAITFLGLWKSFDYQNIGGVDSMVRRMAHELTRRGFAVRFMHYEAPTEQTIGRNQVTSHYFHSFTDLLDALISHSGHIVTIYLRPRDRLNFVRFRHIHRKQFTFSQIYFSYSEQTAKRWLMVADELLMPHNGCVFGISPRLQKLVPRRRGILLLPPVPEEYFVDSAEKTVSDVLRVTYLGRIDPAKGADDAANLFIRLQQTSLFETRVCGYPAQDRPDNMALHEWLLTKPNIHYEPRAFDQHSPEIEAYVARVLRDTDILFLPYKRLSSTIDMPLLLLEGMAALCVPMTRPLGNMPSMIGTSRFLFEDISDVYRTIEKIHLSASQLISERQQLQQRRNMVHFDTKSVVDLFLHTLAYS